VLGSSGWENVLHDHLVGPLIRRLFKAGEVLVEQLCVGDGRYREITEPLDPGLVRPNDLLVRDAERVRAEKWMRAARTKPQKPQAFSQTNDYQQVSCNVLEFHFGPLQAAIVAILRHALRDGSLVQWQGGFGTGRLGQPSHGGRAQISAALAETDPVQPARPVSPC
jgi:hypothetical protein